MTFRFIHTADWQIGKVFRYVDETTMGLLQEARLDAISRLGKLAQEHNAGHVLAAGDVYDKEALAPVSRNKPIERMRAFPEIQWHLLPGNHDPHRPNGLWDQLLQSGLPENVHAHVEPKPVCLEPDTAFLLPAPLRHKHSFSDPTLWMDDAETPAGMIRIGLAHGTITGFGSDDGDVPNLISPQRPDTANLSYLALGDWHGQKKINERCWYSGAHEIDAFDVINGGRALLVEFSDPEATPAITPLQTGVYSWKSLSEQVNGQIDIDHLEAKLRAIGEPEKTLVDLKVEGTLSLEDRQHFEVRVTEGVSAAFCSMRLDCANLHARPTAEDLDQIDRGGFVRHAANELNSMAEAGGESGELADGIYRITKRFVKKPYARLDCPDGTELQGEEAEEKLRTLLNFGKPDNRGAKPESLGMWSVLWVQQGDSFGSLGIPQSARSSLHGALDTQVGAVLGGERGRKLPQAIQARLDELVTPANGRPRGEFKALGERVVDLEESLNQLREHRRELTEALDDLEAAQEDLKRLESGKNDRKDLEELELARERHVELSNLEARIRAAEAESELCAERLEKSKRAVADREDSRQSVTDHELHLKQFDEELSRLRHEENTVRELVDSLRSEVRELEESWAQSNAAESRRTRIVAVARRQDRLRELEDRYKKAKDAEDRLRKSERAAAGILITDELLGAIREAVAKAKESAGQLNAAATRIGFELESKGNQGITINGKPLSVGTATVQAIEETRVGIPGVGVVVVEPAIKDREKLLARQRENLAALDQALRNARVENAAEAESQFERRKQLIEDVKSARREVELYAPATDDCEAGASGLGAYIEGLREIAKSELDELQLTEPPILAEAETVLREFEKQAAEARNEWMAKREAISSPEGQLHRIREKIAKIEGNREDSSARLAAGKKSLEDDEKKCSDAQLGERVEEAQLALEEQQSNVTDLEGQRGGDSLDQLKARISRLDKAIEGRRKKRGELETRMARLQGQIAEVDGAGLDEKIELRKRELELSQAVLERSEREVKVLSLLLKTLRDAESKAKEAHLAPVLSKVRPYLESLFPGARIDIDENLEISGLSRGSGYSEQFQHLSMGTQEQVAVLVRLAFAKMLAEQGNPATVVLDDALVFSDDQRMERMFDILNMAADDVQILILTCREQLFERLGGKALSLETSSEEELVSA
ncbi:MAG: metallophosphoesterase [Gammaproteobacteria bacterium]|nr:metallophosphoesterase [Gammaproteobacteria bacterium]